MVSMKEALLSPHRNLVFQPPYKSAIHREAHAYHAVYPVRDLRKRARCFRVLNFAGNNMQSGAPSFCQGAGGVDVFCHQGATETGRGEEVADDLEFLAELLIKKIDERRGAGSVDRLIDGEALAVAIHEVPAATSGRKA